MTSEPRFITTPLITYDSIAIGPNTIRTLDPDEKPGPGEMIYAGRGTWNNVLIENIDLELGIKHKSLTIDQYTLHGVIPVSYKDGITECVYDYATIEGRIENGTP